MFERSISVLQQDQKLFGKESEGLEYLQHTNVG
jgi:hypothetical protein